MTDQTDENDDASAEWSDDPADWPIAHLGRGDDSDGDSDDSAPAGPTHLRAIVITALVVVVVGLVAGIVVFNSSAPPLGRGAETATAAARQYVTAVNAGDGDAASKISCDSFTAEARAQARSGSDKGISFRLGKVQSVSKSDAVVLVTETLALSGERRHSQPMTLALSRSGGRWLVCGRAG